MDCVDTRGGGARSIDCFILFAWQTGDLMWLLSSRSVSGDASHDCYRWRDSDTSQSLASLPDVYLGRPRQSVLGMSSLPCYLKQKSADIKEVGLGFSRLVCYKIKEMGKKKGFLCLVFEQNKMDALVARSLITVAYVYHVKIEDMGVQSLQPRVLLVRKEASVCGCLRDIGVHRNSIDE